MSSQPNNPYFPKTLLQRQVECSFPLVDIESIAHQLGYKTDAFRERLSKHFHNSFLGLDQSSFDFKYSGEEFLRALAIELKIEQQIVNESLDCIHRFLSKCQNSPASIFVITDFDIKKRRLPIFALAAFEHHRRATFGCNEFIDNKKQMLSFVSLWVAEHYRSHQGILEVWGNIESYLYTDEDGKKYVFQPDGTSFLEEKLKANQVESKAVVRIKGKDL